MKCNAIGIWLMAARALERVKDIYKNDSPKAIAEGLKLIEDDPNVHTVGSYSYPNEDGYLQLDSAYMEGDGKVGAVIEARTIPNPIEVARDLSQYRQNIILAGDGADNYAKEKGYKTLEKLAVVAEQGSAGHDTFGIIILNNDHFYLGVTTSGRKGKHAGRVGDSPLPGAGYYCEDGIGACIATGDGEAVLRNAIAKEVVDHLMYGNDVETALKLAATRAISKLDYDPDINLVAMDHEGNYAAYSSSEIFPFAVLKDDGVHTHYLKSGELKDADDYLRNNYQGD